MEIIMKKVIITLLLAVMSLSLLAGCGTAKTENESTVPIAYSLYCGLNDADTGTQIISTEEAQKIARKVITDKGFGYTEHAAYGAYTENNKSIENVTLIYDMYFIEKEDIDKVADEIRAALNLTPILIVEGSQNYELRQ